MKGTDFVSVDEEEGSEINLDVERVVKFNTFPSKLFLNTKL